MELKQLEAFVYVVKLSSFSRAADTIFLSQPTISAHISSLEKELGAQLLIRSTKEVYPTKAGRELFEYARSILALKDKAVQSVGGANRDEGGEIALLSSSVPAQYLLPGAIAGFRALYPNVVVRVDQNDSSGVAEALCDCYYDFGIVGTRLSTNKFIQKPFCDDTLVIVYPSNLDTDGEYIKRNLESFITSQPFVMRKTGSGTLAETEKYLASRGLGLRDLKPACYFNNAQGVIQAVASGIGISFVSKAAAALYVAAGAVKQAEIDSACFKRSFYLLIKKEMLLSPRQSAFMEFLLDYYPKT